MSSPPPSPFPSRLQGFHGDTSGMFFAGEPEEDARALCDATLEALMEGISVCGPGVPFRAIGAAIHKVARHAGYGTVREFVGHGVGRVFHSAPQIFHFRNDEEGMMEVGATFTIEPMLTLGKPTVRTWPDGWTVVTQDGSLSAQFEHTIVITPDGVEILTVPGDVDDGLFEEEPVGFGDGAAAARPRRRR